MLKYKIIKDFPGNNEKIGSFVYHHIGTFPEYFGDSGKRYLAKDVENYPEFFEKVHELCVPNGSVFKTISGTYYTLNINKDSNDLIDLIHLSSGNKYIEHITIKKANIFFSEGEWILLKQDYEVISYKNSMIHSIKRLSDKEIFSIGDKFKFDNDITHIITKISLDENPDNKRCNRLVPYLECGEDYGCALSIAKKVIQPLFTTHDGVDIYSEWTQTYRVNNDFRLFKVFSKSLYHNCITFSTKEAAEEYIEENKPRFSIKDIKNAKKSLLHISEYAWNQFIRML